ncbi:hypothetical protein TNCV_1659001 [Trichonephila clavipes]|nr:hypothetical protein TNCV_1659001 [Trichonephila clavipes]
MINTGKSFRADSSSCIASPFFIAGENGGVPVSLDAFNELKIKKVLPGQQCNTLTVEVYQDMMDKMQSYAILLKEDALEGRLKPPTTQRSEKKFHTTQITTALTRGLRVMYSMAVPFILPNEGLI